MVVIAMVIKIKTTMTMKMTMTMMATFSMVASDKPRCERIEKRADPTMMQTWGSDMGRMIRTQGIRLLS